MTEPFLTDLDSRAAIKGSLDPLGIQPIWTRFARHVVGNLTTVSNSARDFTVLLLGYHFAERVTEDGGSEDDLAVFLKWEQLAAYARGIVNEDWAFRGTERARKNVHNNRRIRLNKDPRDQILGNQKMYGLWGLYTVPSRSSGLVQGNPPRLTPPGREIVEKVYLPLFSSAGFRNADRVMKLLSRPEVTLDKEDDLLKAVGVILRKRIRPGEREALRFHLLLGGPSDRTHGNQAVLASAIEQTLDDKDWALSPSRMRHLAKLCRDKGDVGLHVAERLERIRTCEMLLAPAAALFDFLLGNDGQSIEDVSDWVLDQWGTSLGRTIDVDRIRDLQGELATVSGDTEGYSRWLKTGIAMAQGDYARALTLLLEQNTAVMKARSGAAPWAELKDGKIQVRFRDEQTITLPEAEALPEYWWNPYFIDAMRSIASALRG